MATSYYKIVDRPLISKDTLETLVPWRRQTIVEDLGAKVLEQIPKYDGFCNIPSHLDFKPVVASFLNRYNPITCVPEEGSFDTIKSFMVHVFKRQYELGLDYLTILYRYPIQPLPILCLVSRERNTGKTTFLNLMKSIFGLNMTYNKNEDFRSQFNSDWAGKLIIAVDEVLLDKREDSERIKNLSTSLTFKSEAKGMDRTEVDFFGKFILCSNNEENFIQIDPGETRYWVIKVAQFDKEVVDLLSVMKKEIPALLYCLKTRRIETPNTSRMWFESKLLKTDALQKVIFKNRSRVETELLHIISEIMDEFDLSKIEMCLSDPLPFLHDSSLKYCKRADIKDLFKGNWGLSPLDNSGSYKKYCLGHNGTVYINNQAKGRYYTITKEFVDEKMNSDDSY